MAYASGKYAYFICDTCGFRYPYKEARGTWENNRVCHECYEPKHPQLDPPSIGADAELLWRPRPDVSLPQAGLGVVTTIDPSTAVINSTTSPSGTRTMTVTDDPIGSVFKGEFGTGEVGTLEAGGD